jgi:hypothetical protein
MQKQINIGLALSLLLAAQIVKAEKVTLNSLIYDLDATKATASLCGAATSVPAAVEVPSVVTYSDKEYTVTVVADQAFYKNATITSVSLPETVTSIGNHSFRECTALKSIALPASLQSIGKNCFSNCTVLTSADLPEGLTAIGEWAFQNTAITAVNWPTGVPEIATCTFYNCTRLQSVQLPAAIREIGINAFNTCTSLVSINLPEGLENLGSGVFGNCTSLAMVRIPESCTAISEQAFYRCYGLRRVLLPSALRTIGKAAFYECTSLTEMTLPETATDLGSNIFYGCTALTSVSLPTGITYVPEGFLYQCLALPKFTIPESVTEIRRNAFFDCESLSSISLPAGVTSIGAGAFSYCPIIEIELPDALSEIGNNAFYYSSIRHLSISANVKSIGQAFVVGCSDLKDITVDEGNAAYRSIDGVLFDKSGKSLLAFPGGKIGKYTLPDSAEEISDYACNKCEGITAIDFNDNLQRIGMSAFFNCIGLKTLQFPKSLTAIGNTAFFSCTSLQRVALPNAQVEFGNLPFYNTGLTALVIPNGQTSLAANQLVQYASALEEVSLPASLTETTLIGENCTALKVIHSFATTAPLITSIGTTVANKLTVKVPVGSSESYKAGWGAYYPNATFVEELPAEATVAAKANEATISWPAYADLPFAGAPERYCLNIDGRSIDIFDFTEGNTISADVDSLRPDTEYAYSVEGYSSYGELTVALSGTFTTESDAAIGEVCAEDCPTDYFDLTGRPVARPQSGKIYVSHSNEGSKLLKFNNNLINNTPSKQ